MKRFTAPIRRVAVAAALMCLAVPASALDLSFQGLDNRTHHLEDYRGQWVVLNVWATWCPPCLEEIPDLIAFHEKHKDRGAVVLGVNYEEITTAQLRNFVRDYEITYPVLIGTPEMEAVLGPLQGMPTTYLVNPEGSVAAWTEGVITPAQIEQFITDHSGTTP